MEVWVGVGSSALTYFVFAPHPPVQHCAVVERVNFWYKGPNSRRVAGLGER